MAEMHPKSKLKRKKCFAELIQPEESRTAPPRRDGDGTAPQTERSVSPAAPWWNREQLPAAERLWLFTLKSALPYLDNQHWDLVPDFPHPSAVNPTALKVEEQRWCDLNEEVSPFPEPAPLRLRSPQQDLSLQTKPVPDPPDRQQSLHSRESHDGKTTTTTTLQSLAKKTQPSLHCWEEAPPSAGSSNVGSEAGREGGEQGEPQAGAVNRQLHTNKMKMSDSWGSLQKEGENEKKVVEDRAAEEVQASFRADGGGDLQSCPMCLMVFPVGFTQMDCDGHLAQCLSEMNMDMTW